jgi:hypothetical protein
MIQLRHRPRFAQHEAMGHTARGLGTRGKELERYHSGKPAITREPHGARATGAEEAFQPIGPDLLSSGELAGHWGYTLSDPIVQDPEKIASAVGGIEQGAELGGTSRVLLLEPGETDLPLGGGELRQLREEPGQLVGIRPGTTLRMKCGAGLFRYFR